MANQREPPQLINMDLALDEAGLQSFVQTVLHGGGERARYEVVAILGPQGSGKSTLLNPLFGTEFEMTDATKDRVQTTEGIFLEKCKEVLVMDVEGSDSGERQGQIKCERKFAAFSFAMTQEVSVNMQNDSIGLDSGACKSLLEAALEFMVCFLGHHKITLIIVVRDKHLDTPVVTIEKKVKRSIDQIWTNIRKLEGLQDKEFDDCLDVSVLLDVIVSSQGRKKYSARQFATEAQEQWHIINNDPELNIQTYEELIDYKRCYEVAWQCIGFFEEELSKILKRQPTEFSEREVEESMHYSLKKYNKATKSFTASAISKGQEILKSEQLKKWKIAFDKRKTELCLEILQSFGDVLETRLNSDTCSDAKKIVEGCITESLEKYQERCRGMMPKHVQWDTTDADSLLRVQLAEKSADIFNSFKKKVTRNLVKDTCVAVLVTAAVVVDVAVTGGSATVGTAAVAAGTEVAVAGGVAALAGGVAAAGSYNIVGVCKKVSKGVKFFIKNGDYHPEKLSASDNLEKP